MFGAYKVFTIIAEVAYALAAGLFVGGCYLIFRRRLTGGSVSLFCAVVLVAPACWYFNRGANLVRAPGDTIEGRVNIALDGMSRIARRLYAYAATHDGRFPAALSELASTDRGLPLLWLFGQGSGEIAEGRAVDLATDFVYLSNLTTSDPPKCVVAFCDPRVNGRYGTAIIRVDGAAEWRVEHTNMNDILGDQDLLFGTSDTATWHRLRQRVSVWYRGREIPVVWSADAGGRFAERP